MRFLRYEKLPIFDHSYISETIFTIMYEKLYMDYQMLQVTMASSELIGNFSRPRSREIQRVSHSHTKLITRKGSWLYIVFLLLYSN